MASFSNEVTNTSSKNDGNDSSEVKQYNEDNRLTYQCNICFNHPKDPVVTKCGHLYCWPCMHQWLQMKPNGLQACPVCRRLISQKEVIPILYRIGTTNRQQDPRKEMPVHDDFSDLEGVIYLNGGIYSRIRPATHSTGRPFVMLTSTPFILWPLFEDNSDIQIVL